jgi:hypothetical protein
MENVLVVFAIKTMCIMEPIPKRIFLGGYNYERKG